MKEKIKIAGKKNGEKYKSFLILSVILLCILVISILVYKRSVVGFYNSNSIVSVMKKSSEVIQLSQEEKKISQTFICKENKINGIELYMQINSLNIEGDICVSLFEKGNLNNSTETKTIDLKEFVDNKSFQILFEKPLLRVNGKEIEISLEIISKSPEIGFYSGSPIDEGTTIRTKIEGEDVKENLHFSLIDGKNTYIKNIYFIMFFLIIVIIVSAYILIFNSKVALEKSFLFILIFVGIIYMFLVPARKAPDEHSHYRTAYDRSNTIMGIKDSEAKSGSNKERNLIYKGNSLEKAKYAYSNFSKKENADEKDEKVSEMALNSPFFLHLPAAIGVTIGRLFGMGNVAIFYLGRLFNLLFFSLCSYFAVKKIPIGKMTLMTICLFPMTLQLASSYSYDAVINGLAILFVSLGLFYIYEKNEIAFKDVIILLILGAFLSTCKGGAYAPLCVLVFLIPKKKFASHKKWLLSLGGIIFGYVSWFCIQTLSSVTKVAATKEQYIGWADEPGYTIELLLKDPIHFAFIIVNTIWVKIDFWIESIVGKMLGEFDISTFSVIIIGFIIILLISLVKTGEENFTIKVSHRVIIIFFSLISVGMIILSMLIGWTPISFEYVEGVQGRYFIPLVLGLLLCIKNNNIIMKNNLNKQLLMSILLLHSINAFIIFEAVFKL